MTIMELEREVQRLKSQLYADHQRLNYLEGELQRIKQGQTIAQVNPVEQEKIPYQGQVAPSPQRAAMAVMPDQENRQKLAQEPSMQTQNQSAGYVPPNQQSPNINVSNGNKGFDLEKFIGKSWMGIMASVLIFISIVLFAVTLLPYLTDNIKMCIMYAVSIAFVAGGLGIFKKSGKLFYMILSACGMGALYISMLLSNIYFKAIGDVTLYIFILTWAVGIAIVAKNSIRTFSIVGNAGIILSILLGTAKCVATDDSVKFLVLMLFFILSAVIYGIINHKFYFYNAISNLLGILILLVGYTEFHEMEALLFFLLLAACLAQLVYMSFRKIRPYFVFHIIYKWVAFLLIWLQIYSHEEWLQLFDFVLNDYVFAFIIYGLSLVSIFFMEYYDRILDEGKAYSSKDIIQIVDIGTIIFVLLGTHIYTPWLLLLAPVVFLGIGFFKKDEKFTVASVVALALSVFGNHDLFTSVLILGIGTVIVAVKQKEEDQLGDLLRAVSSVILRIAVIQFMAQFFDQLEYSDSICATFMLLVILMVDLTFKYGLSHQRKDRAVVFAADLSSMICAIVVTGKLLWEDDGLTYYLTLLVGCVIFMNNVMRYLKSRQTWKQIYAMLKISFYLMIVLISLEQVSIVLSIVFFVVAILWILLGFRMDAKPVRLYGLITSLISIAKLILVDIQYNSSLGKSLGFFICGILAFVISFIYNQFEKNNRKENE